MEKAGWKSIEEDDRLSTGGVDRTGFSMGGVDEMYVFQNGQIRRRAAMKTNAHRARDLRSKKYLLKQPLRS